MNPLYHKYKHKGLPFAQQLTIPFKDVVATSKYVLTSSFNYIPTPIEVEEEDEGINQGDDDTIFNKLVEGSRDSDDPNVGVEGGNVNVTMTKSGDKRKRGGEMRKNN